MSTHDELVRYCLKHGYDIINEYITLGEMRTHNRAVVYDQKANETYCLYYDRSRPKSLTSLRKSRGWRNTTFENRRRKFIRDQRDMTEMS